MTCVNISLIAPLSSIRLCTSDPFPLDEYDALIFENDSMHESLGEEDFQFQFDMSGHSDQSFHNEQFLENEVSCYMHYESEGDDFICQEICFMMLI